jgi:hypothetical protein
MLKLGSQQWEIQREGGCGYCRSTAILRDRFTARQWLQRFKGDALSMGALRRMLSRESSISWRLDRAKDDEIIEWSAQFLGFGAWHVHEGFGNRGLGNTKGTAGDRSTAGKGASPAEPKTAPQPKQAAISSQLTSSSGKVTAPGPATKTQTKLTWVEIQLLDDDGVPVPGIAYEIKLPDGSIKSGTTNSQGIARHEQVMAGMCEVRFPSLHGGDWNPA